MADDALEVAMRALRHRDLSMADVDRKLAAQGYDDGARAQALETLRRTGLADDRRFAESRAAVLASRGSGDAHIRYELERAGVEAELVRDVVGSLEPEEVRAQRVVERRGSSPKTMRYLATRGFASETLSAVVAHGSHDTLG
jgi:SOS response regulatory protein OraA/RecX